MLGVGAAMAVDAPAKGGDVAMSMTPPRPRAALAQLGGPSTPESRIALRTPGRDAALTGTQTTALSPPTHAAGLMRPARLVVRPFRTPHPASPVVIVQDMLARVKVRYPVAPFARSPPPRSSPGPAPSFLTKRGHWTTQALEQRLASCRIMVTPEAPSAPLSGNL